MEYRSPDSRHPQNTDRHPEAYYYPQDEVSLVDLWKILVSKKKFILITVALCVALAIGYAFTQSKIYKAEVLFVPPTAVDVQPFNITELARFTTEELYSRFLSTVSSNAVHKKVFDAQKLAYIAGDNGSINDEALFRSFTRSLLLQVPEKNPDADYIQPVSLSLEGSDSEVISSYLNAVVKEANSQVITETAMVIQKKIDARLSQIPDEIARIRELTARQRQDEIARIEEADAVKHQQILDKIVAARDKAEKERIAEISRLQESDSIQRQKLLDEIATLREHASLRREAEIARLEEADRIKREQIEDAINSLRSNAKAKRLDRIKALQEAANIAHELEVKGDASSINQQNSQTNQPAIYAEISRQRIPTYLSGEKALRAEINELKSRSSDDPFIPNLRSLQDQLKQLEVNEQVEALKARSNDDPFIAELPALLDRLKQLETNERVAALKARESNDPFTPELIGLESQLQLLGKNRSLERLKSRVSDDPFIPELRKLELEQLKLNAFVLDIRQATSANVDQAAFPSSSPTNPRLALILVLGVILGLMLGVFVAFFVRFIEKVRESRDVDGIDEDQHTQGSNKSGENPERQISPPRVVAN